MGTEAWTCTEEDAQKLIADYLGREIGVLEMPRWSMILHWRRAEERGSVRRGAWEELLRAMDRAEELGN